MTARSRLCVLGLDGLSLDIANFLAPHCPNLATITTQAGTLRSELPELSPVNWTSFFTGKGPEKHGIYGFTSINPQTYQLFINNFTQVACPTLFDSLGQRAKISKSINLPTTFPARSLRGMMISGFVAMRSKDIRNIQRKSVQSKYARSGACSHEITALNFLRKNFGL